MKPELENLEHTVGAKLRQAMVPVSLSPEAIERMRPRPGAGKVVPLAAAPSAAARRPWTRQLLAVSLTAAVAGAAFLGLTPTGRALAKEVAARVTSVWTGQVGKDPGELLWVEQSIEDSKPVPGARQVEIVGTVAEAAAKVGFEPVQITAAEAELSEVKVTLYDGAEYQSRWVNLTYMVKGRPYKAETIVHYRRAGDQWRPIPQSTVVGYAVSEQPTRNIRTIKVGETEGLAFELLERKVDGKEFWRTDVTWLPPGNQRIVRFHGSDPALTETLAKSAR